MSSPIETTKSYTEQSQRKIARLLIAENLVFTLLAGMMMNQVVNPEISKFTLMGEVSTCVLGVGMLYVGYFEKKYLSVKHLRRLALGVCTATLLFTYVGLPIARGYAKGSEITNKCNTLEPTHQQNCIKLGHNAVAEGFELNNSIVSAPIIYLYNLGKNLYTQTY